MTVAELIEALKAMPQDALVIHSKDSEGNGFSPIRQVDLCRYAAQNTWSGEYGLYELTDEDRAAGYTEEDLVDGPPAVCLWPIN